MAIRVVFGEDNLLVREGVVRLLGATGEIDVVAAVGDLDSVNAACERERPDVVITDIRMPPTNSDEGIRLALDLGKRHPEIGVVVLSQFAEPGYALALFENGSDRRAHLLKQRVPNPAEPTPAVPARATGGPMIHPEGGGAPVAG